MSKMTKAFLTSNDQGWITPPDVFLWLQPEFNFKLDVAASHLNAQADRYYTEEIDAFKQNWADDADGGDAWCNPPYGDDTHPVSDWAERAWEYRRKLTTVMLLPMNKQDQDWFHDLVVSDGEYRPVRGRIPFLDSVTKLPPKRLNKDGKLVSVGNSQGSMLCIFGPKAAPGRIISFDYRAAKKAYKALKQEGRP